MIKLFLAYILFSNWKRSRDILMHYFWQNARLVYLTALERPERLLATLSSSARGDWESVKNRGNNIGGATELLTSRATVLEGPGRLVKAGETVRLEQGRGYLENPLDPLAPWPTTLDPRPTTLDPRLYFFFASLFIKFGKQYQVNVGSLSATTLAVGLTLAHHLRCRCQSCDWMKLTSDMRVIWLASVFLCTEKQEAFNHMLGLKLGKRRKQWPNIKMCLASCRSMCIHKTILLLCIIALIHGHPVG